MEHLALKPGEEKTDIGKAKIDLHMQDNWRNHLVCYRDDCGRFPKSQFSNLHPTCEDCLEHLQFKAELLLMFITEKEPSVLSQEFTLSYLRRMLKGLEYLMKRKTSNFVVKPSVTYSKEEIEVSPTDDSNRPKVDHDDNEGEKEP